MLYHLPIYYISLGHFFFKRPSVGKIEAGFVRDREGQCHNSILLFRGCRMPWDVQMHCLQTCLLKASLKAMLPQKWLLPPHASTELSFLFWWGSCKRQAVFMQTSREAWVAGSEAGSQLSMDYAGVDYAVKHMQHLDITKCVELHELLVPTSTCLSAVRMTVAI